MPSEMWLDAIRETGGIAAKVRLVIDVDTEVHVNAAKSLGSLCVGHADNKDTIRDAGGIATLVGLLNDADTECAVLRRTYFAFSLTIMKHNPFTLP